MNVVRSIKLAYQEGSSDKVYLVQIVQAPGAGPRGYEVRFQYGRRGGTLKCGLKTAHPASMWEADVVYNTLVAEKRAKGYKEV
jgi:predicted DNA-binding WGR domain protein